MRHRIHKRHAQNERQAHHKRSQEDQPGDTQGGVAVLEDRRRNPASLPVSDKVQPYDPAKGSDLTKYDMRRGEIGIPSIPNPHPPANAFMPGHQSSGLCVECGKPIALGQTYVCRAHIHRG